MWKCHACGSAHLSPSPQPDELAALYSEEYGAYGGDKEGRRGRLKEAMAKLRAVGEHRTTVGDLARLGATALELLGGRTTPLGTSYPLTLPRNARILDFGCGAGEWLLNMQQRGYSKLYALDVPQPALSLLSELGIRVVNSLDELAGESFDLVRMNQVLEHLPDPVEVLERVRTMLAPDGVLLIEVPNYGCDSARILDLDWPPLRLPYHLFHFTPGGLQRVLTRAGYIVLDFRLRPIVEYGPEKPTSRVRKVLAHGSGRLSKQGEAMGFLVAPAVE